ncbi:MAG: lactate racemase domain-containing protein [Caldilineaceae bacterium]
MSVELMLTPVRQQVSMEAVADVRAAVHAGMAALPLAEQVKPGMRVCVAVGSRGISCYAEVVGAVVESLLDAGADPFLVPAMGSHGAATAEGQREVLLGYGMGKLGVPILSSLETVQIGSAPDGMPVLWDRNAAQADAVIPVNRVKAHTAFRAPWESGLFKMLAIGLGKPAGADVIHAHGVSTAMPKAARIAIASKPVIAGVAIVENGQHNPARVAVIPGQRIERDEPPLLELAKRLQPGLPFDPLDLLIVQEMGKDISGTGMDTNVIGMWRRNAGPREPDYRCIAVLELTPDSHGNASGIGMADLIPQRLVEQVDWQATYTNCLTARNFAGAKQPATMPHDRAVIDAGLAGIDLSTARVALIKNTLELSTLWLSAALLAEVEMHPALEVIGPARPLAFDADERIVFPVADALLA